MSAFGRSSIAISLASAVALLATAAQAQEKSSLPLLPQQQPAKPQAVRPPQQATQRPAAPAQAAAPRTRIYAGSAYRGRFAWEGGHWHQGRQGWWWDVGGVRYYYPEPLDGPPDYVSDYYVDDGYVAPAGYPPPPPAYVAAPPPPPPQPADPGASAVGGAIVGGLLGGLLTGRPEGFAAGAIAGGATGAIAGATAASQPGYYWANGGCYYRYPSGQYVATDPRSCY